MPNMGVSLGLNLLKTKLVNRVGCSSIGDTKSKTENSIAKNLAKRALSRKCYFAKKYFRVRKIRLAEGLRPHAGSTHGFIHCAEF